MTDLLEAIRIAAAPYGLNLVAAIPALDYDRIAAPAMRAGTIDAAKLAGLAGPSILGVVVHPEYGPWIAFRAALILDVVLDQPGAAIGFDPCPTCKARSCITPCPAGAV